jgi:FtsP/CotA-like multicopper oxidase with cupredoxin domain
VLSSFFDASAARVARVRRSASTELFALVLFAALPLPAVTRHYYIAAENVTWNFAPSGMDLMNGGPIPDPWSQKTSWPKTRYIEYSDSTFGTRKPQPEWLGILGPIIRAEVGDTIEVEFLNRTSQAHSIHPHGVLYDKANEGALYVPAGPGAQVRPGVRFTYHWVVDEASGPGKGDGSSVVWWYHGHTDPSTEINAGLLGPIIVTAKGKARPDGSPKDVDREFVTAFVIFDQVPNRDPGMAYRMKDPGMFYTINGYVFGNLPGLVMKKGERVRWYALGMGSEQDLHTAHWHGNRVDFETRHSDVVELLPGSMKVADMIASNTGSWMLHCHVSEHMESGMMATYTVYEPQRCSSPIQITAGDFWNETGKFHITVKNVSSKPIQKITVSYDHLMSEQYRRRPFENLWTWNTTVAPGQEQTFEAPGYPPGAGNSIAGWALFPRMIAFSDGTTWQPSADSQCFSAFWRDKDHAPLEVLPPLFIELNAD